MKIPNGECGYPTLRTSHFRVYGAGGLRRGDMDLPRGCPRQYKARYVDERPDATKVGFALLYGQVIHDVLYRMEEHEESPDVALQAAWDPELPVEAWDEILTDLERYMARSGPTDLFSTIAVEQNLEAELYVDEDFGPIWFGGRLDRLAIDIDAPQILHLIDYKSNRAPPSKDDVARDIQLRGYVWLAHQMWDRWMGSGKPQVVAHMEALKWRDIEHWFTDRDIRRWRDWAEALARKILRDDDAVPVLNDGCSDCPVNHDCPVWLDLPGEGARLLSRRGVDLDSQVIWRLAAKGVVRQLNKGIDQVKAAVTDEVTASGPIEAGGWRFYLEDDEKWTVDLHELQRLLGDRFLEAISTSKAAITRLASRHELDPGIVDQLMACFEKYPAGQRLIEEEIVEDAGD